MRRDISTAPLGLLGEFRPAFQGRKPPLALFVRRSAASEIESPRIPIQAIFPDRRARYIFARWESLAAKLLSGRTRKSVEMNRNGNLSG